MSAHYLICLEDREGTELGSTQDGSGLVDDIIVPASQLRGGQLQFIDNYGTTTFNVLQVEALLKELQAIETMPLKEEQLSTLHDLISLAKRVEDEPHRFLKFYGD